MRWVVAASGYKLGAVTTDGRLRTRDCDIPQHENGSGSSNQRRYVISIQLEDGYLFYVTVTDSIKWVTSISDVWKLDRLGATNAVIFFMFNHQMNYHSGRDLVIILVCLVLFETYRISRHTVSVLPVPLLEEPVICAQQNSTTQLHQSTKRTVIVSTQLHVSATPKSGPVLASTPWPYDYEGVRDEADVAAHADSLALT